LCTYAIEQINDDDDDDGDDDDDDLGLQEASTLRKDRQKWTIFIQLHRQQPDGDSDAE